MSFPPPLGNKYGLALKDPKIRQKAYKLFCDHLAKGKSIKSWCYEDDEGNSCTWGTMLSYIKDSPHEFDPIKKELAEIKGYNRWEEVAEASAEGKNKRANTASLQMVMRNKFGWDKEEKNKDKQIVDLENDLKSVAAHIASLDSKVSGAQALVGQDLAPEQSLLYQELTRSAGKVQAKLGPDGDTPRSASV
jgi:hypothetical protein